MQPQASDLSRRRFCFLTKAPLLAVVVALVVVQGCSGEVQPKCRITGQAMYRGQPAANVCLRFHVANDAKLALRPSAVWTNPDGTFELKVATPGEYLVTAVWPEITEVEGESIEGADQLRGAWGNMLAPQLKKTISEGENTIPPIELAVFDHLPQLDPDATASY